MIIRQSTTHFNNIEKKCTALSDIHCLHCTESQQANLLIPNRSTYNELDYREFDFKDNLSPEITRGDSQSVVINIA